MNPSKPVKKQEVQQRYDEGNHCFIVKQSGGSGESGEKRYNLSERTYPEVAGIEMGHCFNYGNWRYLKSRSTKTVKGNSVTVWKCIDCGHKLQKVHMAGSSEQLVTYQNKGEQNENQNDDGVLVHNWKDKRHALTKPKRKKVETPLHPSVSAIFAYYEKTG